MRHKTLQARLALLGPGLMLAAAAVGVSHLVQSTRVGSDYGFSLVWAILLIAVLKYPAFRFAVDYAAGSGNNLVQAYASFGRIARAWLYLGFFVDMFIATAAVALVTAGLVISIFGLPASGPPVALALVVLTALLLVNGRYAKAEVIVKLLVAVFSLLTVVAALLALPDLGSNGRGVFGEVTVDRSLFSFLIAVTGWMPLPLTGSIFLSMWVIEKRASAGAGFDHAAAVRDLQIGWILTVLIALFFVLLGTAVLFQTARTVPTGAGQFATELLQVFTSVIGHWSYPIIAAAALAVMWSTLVTLMDALPRVTSALLRHGGTDIGRTGNDSTDKESDDKANMEDRSRFNRLLFVQVSGVAVVLLALMNEFGTFIDFATGTGFITAPALMWYNYRAVTGPGAAAGLRPGPAFVAWHWAGFAALSVCAIAFLLQRFELWPFAS